MDETNLKTNWRPARLMLWAAGILALGALLAWLDGKGIWVQGWVAYSLLLGLAAAGIHLVGKQVQAVPSIQRVAWVAFAVRLGTGLLLTLLLPIAGHADSDTTLHGYLYDDANFRDYNAWTLAQADRPLIDAFGPTARGDQYGGMLFLSAAIYRYLSPGVHRQVLVIVLSAAAAALGTLFLWRASRTWFGEPIAKAAAWVFALYPEAVLLGSSQMREAFVTAAIAAAFYGLTRARHGGLKWLGWMAGAAVVLLFFQPAGGAAAFVMLGGLWLFDPQRRRSWGQPLALAAIGLVFLVIVYSVWAQLPSLQGANPLEVFTNWLVNNFRIQALATINPSGQVQVNLPSWLALLVYGVARPVLPAALTDPAPLIWRTINVLRAGGWYLLAPFLLYGFWRSFSAQERRAQLIWMNIFGWIWILVASANGGADGWDNPRYRVIFLAWQALLAAWAWREARLARDPWLERGLLVEAVFILLFTEWYLSRFYPGYLVHFSFPVMVGLCLGSAGLILGFGWLQDRRKRLRQARQDEADRELA